MPASGPKPKVATKKGKPVVMAPSKSISRAPSAAGSGHNARLQEARDYLAKVRGENGDDEDAGPLSIEEELIDAKEIIENLKVALRKQARANLNSKKTANTVLSRPRGLKKYPFVVFIPLKAEADAMVLIKKAEETQNEGGLCLPNHHYLS